MIKNCLSQAQLDALRKLIEGEQKQVLVPLGDQLKKKREEEEERRDRERFALRNKAKV